MTFIPAAEKWHVRICNDLSDITIKTIIFLVVTLSFVAREG
jgi:hypothetical protein